MARRLCGYKFSELFCAGEKGGLIYKGIIFIPADFPTLTEVKPGWMYIIGDDVTDNDPTKTNTGQSFLLGDEIVWNGTNWTVLGATALWGDDLTNLLPLNARDINLAIGKIYKINGENIFTRSNSELNTIDKAVFGSINELDDRFYNGLQHPTGFEKLTDCEILYYPAVYEIRLQPKLPATSFSYHLRSKKYTVSSTLTITHNTPSGLYYFYFDKNNVLQFTSASYNLLTDVPISYVQYSSLLLDGFAHEERHSSTRNPPAHLELHNQIGAYVRDLTTDFLATGYNIQPVTPTDADNTFGLSHGYLFDEDIPNYLGALPDGGPYTVLWRFGSGTDWLWDKALTVPFKSGTYIQYNHVTVGNWGLSDVPANQYVCIWVIKNPSLDPLFQSIIISPQNVHSTLVAARAEILDNLNLLGFNILEGARIYKFIYRTSPAYTSTGKVRIEDVERLSGRSTRITQAGVIEHNALAGLQLAGAGVTWGHINDQDQIIPGIKTFSSLIVNDSFAPFLALGEGGSLTDFSKIMDIGDSLRLYKQSETSTSIVGIDAVAAGSPANLEIRLFENSTISTGTVKLKIWSSDSNDKVRYDYDCRTAIISRNLSGTISSRTDASVVTNEAQSGFMTNTETAFLVKQWTTDTLAYDLGLIKFGTEGNWTSVATSRDSYFALQTVKDGILGDALSINSDKDALIFGNLSTNEFLRFPTASNFSMPPLEKAVMGVVDLGSGDFRFEHWIVSTDAVYRDFRWSAAKSGGNTVTYAELDETGFRVNDINERLATYGVTIQGIKIDEIGADSFEMIRGTTNFIVNADCTINQDLSSISNPTFATLNITGKLTVGGAIDPTALILDAQGSVPSTVAGTIYYDSASQTFKFREGAVWHELGGDGLWTRISNTLEPTTIGDSIKVTGNNIWIEGVANPALIISKGGLVNNYISIQDKGPTQATINKVALTGGVQLDINPILMDGSSAGSIRLFRDTNTTGETDLLIYKGNSTPTIMATIQGKTGQISSAFNDGIAFQINEPTVTKQTGFGVDIENQFCRHNPSGMAVYSKRHILLMIDSSNVSTDAYLEVRKNSTDYTGGVELIRINEAGELNIGAANGYNMGSITTNGSWRMIRSGNNLVFQRRESDSWVIKNTILA